MGAEAEPHQADRVLIVAGHRQAAQKDDAAPFHDLVIDVGDVAGDGLQREAIGGDVVEFEALGLDVA